MTGFKEFETLSPTQELYSIDDPFSIELLTLWKGRKMEGRVFQIEKEETGEVAGYLLLEVAGDTVTIRGLYICEGFRRKGIGNRLLSRCLQFIELTERKHAFVNITEGAERLYQKYGFVILGKRKDFPDQSIAYRGEKDIKVVKKEVKRKIQ